MRRSAVRLRVAIDNWKGRLARCTTDEEGAQLLASRFKGKLVQDKEVRMGRGKVLRETLEALPEIGISVLSAALMVARGSMDHKANDYVMSLIKKKNITPDSHLRASMLHNVSTFARHASEIENIAKTVKNFTDFEYEVVIRGYVRVHDRRRTLSTFKTFKESLVPTRTSVFDAVIPVFENYAECKQHLKEMQMYGLKPSVYTLARMINVCKKTNDVANAEKIFDSAKAHGLDGEIVRTSMLTHYIKANQFDRFDSLWGTLKNPSDSLQLQYLIRCNKLSDVKAAEACFFPLARSRTGHIPIWRQMLDIYASTKNPHRASELCCAYLYLSLPHDGPFQLLYESLTKKVFSDLPTNSPPSFLTEPLQLQDYLPESWVQGVIADLK